MEFDEEHFQMIVENNTLLKSVNEKLDNRLSDHEERIRCMERNPGNPVIATKVERMETQIRNLENWQWKVVGIAIGASAVITVAVTLIEISLKVI